MHVLVTGANGFIGSHLVDYLLEQGHQVRAFVRPTASLTWLTSPRVELLKGDLLNKNDIDRALQGVHLVFHVAGTVVARDWKGFYRANVIPTRNLLEVLAARHATLARFVLVSSTGASGPGSDERLVDEQTPPCPAGDYGRSKLMAERIAESFSHVVPTTIVRPCAVYGPRDRNFLIMFRHVLSGVIPVLGSGEQLISLIHVRDLVRGLVLASVHPATAGECYFLTSERPYPRSEILATAERVVGTRARRLVIPDRVLAAVPRFQDIADKFRRGPRLLSPERLATLSYPYWAFSGHKAREHFGFRPEIPLEAGLRETYAWYLAHGWVKRRPPGKA